MSRKRQTHDADVPAGWVFAYGMLTAVPAFLARNSIRFAPGGALLGLLGLLPHLVPLRLRCAPEGLVITGALVPPRQVVPYAAIASCHVDPAYPLRGLSVPILCERRRVRGERLLSPKLALTGVGNARGLVLELAAGGRVFLETKEPERLVAELGEHGVAVGE